MDTLFFIASKLVWALFKPGTWLVLLLALIIYLIASERHRAAILAAGTGLLLTVLFSVLPVGDLLLSPLEHHYPPEPEVSSVAGIIVLGGGEAVQRSAHWAQPQVNDGGDRFMQALALARQYPSAKVLFTGGIGSLRQDGPSGADVARQLLTSSGLDPSRLVLETRSRNTAENAVNSLELRSKQADGDWILVTSAFHMPRSIETFCAAGWSDLVPWPTDYRTVDLADGMGWSLTANLINLETALKERIGLLVYRLTGRADKHSVAACLATA